MIDPKKLLYAILAAAVLVSCGNNIDPEDPEPGPEPRPEPETRSLSFVLPSGGLKTAWEAGDQIVVHGEFAAEQVTVKLESGDISADGRTATKSVENLFPYANEDCTSTLYASWPAEAADNLRHCFYYSMFNTTNKVLLAACNNGDTFNFKDISSKLTFTVKGDYEEFVVNGIKKTVLGYEFIQVLITDKTENLMQYKGAPIYVVQAPFKNGLNTACFPGDIDLEKGYVLKFRKGGRAVKIFSVPEKTSFKRGSAIDLGDITSLLEDYDDPLSDDIKSLDENGGANCYIVDKPGTFKFKALKGNSKDEIGEAASADILWETWNDGEEIVPHSVVASVKYSDDYMIIHMPETIHPGNAVVVARDIDSTILWSWHIWVPQTPITTAEFGGIMGAPVMSRNLGALVDTEASAEAVVDPLSYGLVYQWGRKDPFVSTCVALDNVLASQIGAEEEVAPGQITLAESIANPRRLGHINNGNWMDEVDETLWSDDGKTIYDPCPPGYRVPPRNTNVPFWASDLSTQKGWAIDPVNGWITIGDPVAVFPIAGYRDDYSVDEMAKVGTRTLYWTAHGSDAKAAGADLRYDKSSYIFGSAPKARLASVRCIAE